MKRFLLILSISFQLKAQTPQGISYQAVARDNAGNILANQSVNYRFSILQGSMSGTTVYQETHTSSTNSFGLSNLTIGLGVVNSGSFSLINWANGPFYLQVEFAISASSFQTMGTSQFVSVPYALYAQHGGDKLKAGKGITISGDSIHSTWTQNGNDITTNNNGNVGIGTSPANQKLEVGGGMIIGNTSNSTPGSLRYNGSDFEGATGSGWKSLTQSSVNYYESNMGYFYSYSRNTMVVSPDSMITPETGNYLILYSGRGTNSNSSYDLINGSWDGEGRTGILNVTNNLNWLGGVYASLFETYIDNTSTSTYRKYIDHTFTVSTYAHLNAGDVLKLGAWVPSAGSGPFNAWDITPFKLQLIKLN